MEDDKKDPGLETLAHCTGLQKNYLTFYDELLKRSIPRDWALQAAETFMLAFMGADATGNEYMEECNICPECGGAEVEETEDE